MKEQSTEREVESSPTWEALEAFARQGLQGLQAPRPVIGDGHLGIWGALAIIVPTAAA